MMSDSMLGLVMEIRKVDTEMAEWKKKLQQSHKNLVFLDESINEIKQLQTKAQAVIVNTEMKMKSMESELKGIHESYDELAKYLNKHFDTIPERNFGLNTTDVEKLKKRKDELEKSLKKAKVAKEEVARKLNDVEMQINIQKKKNSAFLLRLQKNLEELLQEERNLSDKLKENYEIVTLNIKFC